MNDLRFETMYPRIDKNGDPTEQTYCPRIIDNQLGGKGVFSLLLFSCTE